MSITTVGGSGTTSQSLASGAGQDVNLFTTPNTANMIFLVTVIIAGGCSVGTADRASQAAVAAAAPDAGIAAAYHDQINSTGNSSSCVNSMRVGNGGHPGNPGHAGGTGKEGSQTEHIKTIKMKVGPNTPVHVSIFNSDQATRTINVSWNYCGVAFA